MSHRRQEQKSQSVLGNKLKYCKPILQERKVKKIHVL